MKKTILAAATAVLAVAGAVQAGGPIAVADDPVPMADAAPAPTVDWSGAYAGLTYGQTSGDVTSGISTFDYDKDRATGAFLGYNVQRGQLVYGGELAFASTDTVVLGGGGDDTVDSILDLRGRVGLAAGKALIYGSLGYSKAEMTVNATDGASPSGLSYGVGVDLLVTNSMFVGLDYTRRNLDGRNDLNTFDLETSVNTVGLRVGLSF